MTTSPATGMQVHYIAASCRPSPGADDDSTELARRGSHDVMDDDKGFFILVLGVLAAIIMIVTWTYTSDDGGVTGARLALGERPGAAGQAEAEPGAVEADTDTESGGADRVDEAGSAAQVAAAGDDPGAGEAPAEARAEPESVATAPGPPFAGSVFDALAAAEELSVLTGLLRDHDLDGLLAGPGPFTVFAPTNDAIARAAASDAILELLEARPPATATVAYHIVPGDYPLDELTKLARDPRGGELTSLQGEPLAIDIDGDVITIGGVALVVGATQMTDNGVLHRIDDVLVPTLAALNMLVDLDPILFTSGSATIDPASFATLDRFIDILNRSDIAVTVEGHTDDEGDAIINQDLSESRARAVVNYLVANGVAESRLRARGFGAERPVADNATEAGRALNRRIDFSPGE